MHYVFCPLCGTKLTLKQLGDDGNVPWCNCCSKPFFDSFSTCVIVLVMDRDNRIAILNEPDSLHGSLVAGYMKPGETAEEAARREVTEELGLEVESIVYRDSYWFCRNEDLMLGFQATVLNTEFMLSCEVEEARWIAPKQALSFLRKHGPAYRLVQQVLKDRHICASCYDEENSEIMK